MKYLQNQFILLAEVRFFINKEDLLLLSETGSGNVNVIFRKPGHIQLLSSGIYHLWGVPSVADYGFF